jgi:MoxR-like ATPase
MDYKELKNQVSNCKDFERPEVTACIESLNEEQTLELSKDGTLMNGLLGGVKDLRDKLKELFIGRDELIEIGLACFVAHLPMVALGPPGTAKSNLFRVMSYALGLQNPPTSISKLAEEMRILAQSIEVKDQNSLSDKRRFENKDGNSRQGRGYFEYLVTRFTTPEELLGPAHLSLMINHAVFYRQTSDLLPEAQVAFIDEIFKANSAILNALLSIMNERIFYNAGRPTRVPLCMVYGASNEPPEEKELLALYDRFPVRVPCLPIDDTFYNSKILLRKSTKQACDDLFPGDLQKQQNISSIKQVATVNHFRLLHKIIHVKYGGRLDETSEDKFEKDYYNTFRSLRREFGISDRSYFKLYTLARGLALLRRKEKLEPEELDVFKYCFHGLEAVAPLRDAVDERIHRLLSRY